MSIVGAVIIIILVLIIVWRAWATWNNNHVQNPSRQQDFNAHHSAELQNNGITISNTYSYTIKGPNAGLINVIYFQVAKSNKKVVISDMTGLNEIIPFSDIIGSEILIDSQVAGGVGRAVVGGVIAGGAGAVVGAVTAKKYIMSYSVVIYTRNIDLPRIQLDLISKKTDKSDPMYKEADEFAKIVNAVIKSIFNQ